MGQSLQKGDSMRYIYKEEDRPEVGDYYYEARHITNKHFPPVSAHTHNFYEIYLPLTSKVCLSVEDTIFEVNIGDIMVIPPHTIHQLLSNDEDVTLYKRMYMYISRQCIDTLQFNEHSLTKPMDAAHEKKRYHFTIKDEASYKAIHDAMYNIYKSSELEHYDKEMYNRGQILTLLTALNNSILCDLSPKGIVHAMDPVSEQILTFINEHFMEDLSVASIAEHFFLSKTTLTHMFKSQTQQTIHSYLVMKRVSMAKQSMSNGITPLDAATMSGFKDYSTFYRTFKRLEGLSPKEFYKRCNAIRA
ncbi:AraC family transcriptional regulator [Eubacterium xylanophilum]|uniref:AraC family transcriptional regulator n=1 Tax=Eubacterium xylanophilum TaxID=39497 RepID=UPI00047BE22D|nr:helix-turn-helix domain-containing protein [Eubacterium xylanophilum]